MRSMVNTESPSAVGEYTTWELARLAGSPPKRVSRWHQMGVFPATGRVPGTFSYADAAESILAHYLIDVGLRPGEVAKLVENLRERYGNWPLSNAPLEHEGRLVVVREDGDVYLDVLHHLDQRVIEATLDLRKVRDALAHGGWVALKNRREAIEVDPEKLSGLPTVRGRRLTTLIVADVAAEPDGLETLRTEYGLSRQEIDETVAYESDVRKAIAA
jgi:uncharacterized protein (DUF433 family)